MGVFLAVMPARGAPAVTEITAVDIVCVTCEVKVSDFRLKNANVLYVTAVSKS